MKRKHKRAGRIALALLFLLPILAELSSYITDENEYEAMAERMPSESTSIPALPIATLLLEPIEELSSYEILFLTPSWDATEQPIAEPSFMPLPTDAV